MLPMFGKNLLDLRHNNVFCVHVIIHVHCELVVLRFVCEKILLMQSHVHTDLYYVHSLCYTYLEHSLRPYAYSLDLYSKVLIFVSRYVDYSLFLFHIFFTIFIFEMQDCFVLSYMYLQQILCLWQHS